MSLNRFYCEKITVGRVELDQVESHHLAKVMRQVVGDEVEVFDGKGVIATAVVSEISRKGVWLEAAKIERVNSENNAQVIIAASVAKGQRQDWLVSKCTELGVDDITSVIFERTVKQPKGANAVDRYNKLAITAAKQCGRSMLPKIGAAKDLEAAVSELKRQYPQAKMVFGGFGESAVSIGQAVMAGEDVIAFVGPEGGLTETEMVFLKESGCIEVSLTSTILRIETAAVAFAAVLCTGRDQG